MPYACVVLGCSNRSNRETDKSFFRVPRELIKKGERTQDFTKRRRERWLSNLSVQSKGAESKHARVCSDHFVKGCPSGLFNDDDIDWAPTLKLGHDKVKQQSEEDKERETEIPPDEEENEDVQMYDDVVGDEEEYEDSDYAEEEPMNMDEEAEREWLARLQENLETSTEKKSVSAIKATTPRSEVTLGRLTKRFMDLLHSAPGGILDLNEATRKLGTRKRRVYDITNVLNGIKLITKKSKSKIQWVGPSPISCFKGQWKTKMKNELLNLKTMEESLDWLIKDCAQQLFALTDLAENANSAYVTYEDICQLAAFQDQTVIAIKAPEETKLEVPTPTEECIKIHLKGSRGPIHVLTCETSASDASAQPEQLKNGRFLTLEESRIETTPLLTDLPTVSSAVRSA
ncbi:transcription factor E2F6 isoform X2 [Neoarius graeffei]|uniref:transcription factor E2F6 isoform X2 n=1 Tax=Neoarius graeffei TaxID=443677 RepID=UPI00298C85C5|nr:transcription factor E2F6 isoform X2 [Neoarius graeffei]